MLYSDPNLLSILAGKPNIKSTLLQVKSFLKRLVDIALSIFGIILFSPFLPLVALLIKLDSNGPVFYLADRVGRNFKNFRMWKFRTMIDTPIEVGESVSPQFDPRVTPAGRFLRRTKINELPQLVNILKGEMTFVGPRPEAPDLAELYPEEAKKVFSAKPGLVGPAAIIGRNEEEVYPPGVDVKKYYIENILPNKNKIDLEYIENQSLLKDLKYIYQGVRVTLIGAISKRHIHDNWSQLCLLFSDGLIITCSYFCASIFYSWTLSAEVSWAFAFFTLPIVILTRLAWNIYFSLYSSLIRYISYNDIAGVFKGVSAGSFSLVLIAYALGWIHYQGIIAVIDWAFLILFLSSMRLILRLYWDIKHRQNDQRKTYRILIYGVCDEGNAACRAFASDRYFPFEIVGFIDDAPGNIGKTVNGKRVLGDRHHIAALARLYRIDEILIAQPEIQGDKFSDIQAICTRANLKCRYWNPMEDLNVVNKHISLDRSRNSANFIPLKRFHADHAAVTKLLTGRTVLMNGSGGALGLELCRTTLQRGCRKLVILDRYESYLNELVAALMKEFSLKEIAPVFMTGDDPIFLEKVFTKYHPTIVFHAGMRKYASFLGVDLGDVGRINYLRTFNLAKTASRFNCEMFLMISSSMVPSAGNYVANSLRVAEVSLEHFFSDTNTRLIVARICDVVENRGGIFAIIEDQLRNRETLTLPRADAQACFITKNYGAQFILQSLVDAGNRRFDGKAHFFTCDAGSPILLIKLIERIAKLYGLKLGSDVAVRYMDPITDSVSVQTPAGFSTFHDKIANILHNSAELKTFFRDFVRNTVDTAAIQDWEEWTQRAIEECELVS